MSGKGWVAIGAALTGLTMCPLLGCGGRAVDGERPGGSLGAEDDVLFEALPERLVDCDALHEYTHARAEELLALAPTGNPLQPLFEPNGSAGFEQAAYAEWPDAARVPGAGRVAHARRPGSSTDDFYLVTNDAVPGISVGPSLVAGTTMAMPAALKQARDGAAPAWIFADGARVLVVGELDGAAVSAAGAGTFFWRFELDGSGVPLDQELQYVDARLIGARRSAGSVQVLMVAGGSRLGFQGLPAGQRADGARLAGVRADNERRIAAASAGDWLPRRVTADTVTGSALAGATAPAIECSDIYAPATPSGLELLTLVDVDLAQGLASWQASGLYTGSVQVFAEGDEWALVTEPWWSVSEEAAALAGLESPETLLHTFGTRARQLEPRGSIGLRAAPQHDPAVAHDGQHWLLATHKGYGAALDGADQGQLWSFVEQPGSLALLGRSPTFPLSRETQTEFAPGVAYVHTPGSDGPSLVIDLSNAGSLELKDGPGADFRIFPWSNGQHLLVDLRQLRLRSGLKELTSYEQWAEPSLEGYAIPEYGLLLDIPPESRALRVHRLPASDPPEPMGSIRIREATLLPPLIANGVLLSAYFKPATDRAGGGSMKLEMFDATTMSTMGGVSGDY
jgi:hypothetical protein